MVSIFAPAAADTGKLQARTGLSTPELQTQLLTLELDGTVRRWPLSMLEGHMPETPAAAALTAEEEAELAELMEGEV